METSVKRSFSNLMCCLQRKDLSNKEQTFPEIRQRNSLTEHLHGVTTTNCLRGDFKWCSRTILKTAPTCTIQESIFITEQKDKKSFINVFCL